MTDHHQLANFIWQIADLLRGPYRPPQYERVMLPMTVLRRFDCVLAPTKSRVLAEYDRLKDQLEESDLDERLNNVAAQPFHNRSLLDFEQLKSDPRQIERNLRNYIESFSENVRKIFERFDFDVEIDRMREAEILHLIIVKFCDVDLHPNAVDNIEMGRLFENLIRRFDETANETAGDYFTPREVIRLMVKILFTPDDDILTQPGIIRKLLDPACGTGGMLTEAQNYLLEHHSHARLQVFGQDFNPRAYAIAASDLLMKGSENSVIGFGDTLTNDQFPGNRFDYLLAHPPFGVDWKKQQRVVRREHEKQGFDGRFGAGLPRVNDGSLLFLQHMISKFEPIQPEQLKFGSRLAIVFNGSPLFTGGAGSGESEIRKWVIEKDWLEAIIALPEQMFYNTGIGTYIWIVTNRKVSQRKGKVQLIDARTRWQPMRRSLGNKRRYMDEANIAAVVCEYGQFVETETCKIFDNVDFGYERVPIERPLRLLYQMDVERKSRFLDAVPHLLDDVQAIDREFGRTEQPDWNKFDTLINELLQRRNSRWRATERKLFRDVFTERAPDAEPVIVTSRDPHGDPDARVWGWFLVGEKEYKYEPDTQLRDFENVLLKDEVPRYFREEVEQHVPDAWADQENIRKAYEINFNRHFYTYNPPRPLAEIDTDLRRMEAEIVRLLREVVG